MTVTAVAQNKHGDLQGVCTGFLSHTSPRTLTGSIHVKRRNQGLAAPLSLAYTDLLSRLAQLEGPIIEEVYDENISILEYYRQQLAPNDPLLRELEEEHDRWNALYGPNGLMGVSACSERIFHGASHSPDLFTIDSIHFRPTKVDAEGRLLYQASDLDVREMEDSERRRAQEMERLRRDILMPLQSARTHTGILKHLRRSH